MADEIEEKVEALGAWMLVHTSLFGSMMGAMRASGAFTQAHVNQVVDGALVGVENATGVTPETVDQARKILERLAADLGGERESPV